jgi:hypothetical protein
MVIRYSYLWKREQEEGREEGIKDRPCAVIVALRNESGNDVVLVLPVTHLQPADIAEAIEIPAETKRRLRLDSQRSWIVISEANEFIWPGPDLRPVPGRDVSTIDYGALPQRFFAFLVEKYLERYQRGKTARVKRSE